MIEPVHFYTDGSIMTISENPDMNKFVKGFDIGHVNSKQINKPVGGFGVLILDGDMMIQGLITGMVRCKENNHIPEICAGIEVLKWTLDNDIKSIKIYHDFEDLNLHIHNSSNDEYGLDYIYYYNQCIKNKVYIDYIKVKSHSGNKFNDEVDKLARTSAYKWCNVPTKRLVNHYNSLDEFLKV